MDDQPATGVDFIDWFLKWLDLFGECKQARDRMIDADRCSRDLPRSSEITLCSRAQSWQMSETSSH